MLTRLWNYLGLAVAYTRLNLNAQLEYRGAFLSQVVAMFLNDAVWVVFWALFFTRFPVLRGWNVNDVITVWAIAALRSRSAWWRSSTPSRGNTCRWE